MASRDYLRLCREAQREKINIARKQQKEIKVLYDDIYKDLNKRLKKANKDSLNERWLKDYIKELEKEIFNLNNKIEKVIKKNMKKSSELANNVQLDFFMLLNDKYSLDMKETFTGMFSRVPQAAVNEILFGKAYKDRKGLSERIWQNTKKFENDIDYIVSQGIASKKSAYEIAKDLEMYVKPDSAKDWEWRKVYPSSSKKVDYNAQRLARTSVNHAYQQAQIRSCKRNPYVEGIKWLTSNSHRTCQICKDRDGEIFQVDKVPLDHPNGMCTTIPVLDRSLEDIGTDLRKWLDGEHNPKLDEWYKKCGKDFSY